jgi:hypothetical protein
MSKYKGQILIEELLKTIEKIGLDKTIDTLKITQNKIQDSQFLMQEYIIDICCTQKSISKKTLLNSVDNNVNRTNCIAEISYLLNKHNSQSQTQIGYILKKDNSVISKYIKKINQLDNKCFFDIQMIKDINDIEIKIKEFKTKIINNG